jgi:uncharacterized membrane protein YcfT
MGAAETSARKLWVDYARGLCIILVVMMHATLGVEAAFGREGWLHALVEFARPFRIPTFFLLSGLFVARFVDRDWRTFFDRKILHFAYFYFLWLTIQFVFKAPGYVAEQGIWAAARVYLVAFVDPFGSLWFIYLLPIFFTVSKLTRGIPPLAVWLAAAALEIAPVDTGWIVIDEFAARFVYFYSGYILAPRIFAFADAAASSRSLPVAAGIVCAGLLTGFLVLGGYSALPFVSLALGFLGAAAMIAWCVLAADRDFFAPLGYCGRNSLVIYLGFFLPVAATRTFFVHSHLITDVGTVSAIVTLAGILGAIALYWLLRGGRLGFLYERPDLARLIPRLRFAA